MTAITSLRYYPGLKRVVDDGGEAGVLRFLKRYQRPLWVAFARGWNSIALIPEFRFGNRYKADFLLVNAMSGAIYATLIELEPPRARLYTRTGTESKELKAGLRQVKDWHAWVERYPDQFRDQLIHDLETLGMKDPRVPSHRRRFLIGQLRDDRNAVMDEYVIVIGRRDQLAPEDNRRRSYESRWARHVEIATYDRLLEIGHDDLQRVRRSRSGRVSAV